MMGTNTFITRHSAFSPYRLFRRETGFGNPVGAGDALARSLYCGMKPIASWDYEQANAIPTGGVFNLEFSPEGTLLVAACEKKSIQIFDPLTHRRIHTVNAAHADCVNCVKFLDSRMFATCSDDTTIALWDVRNLSKKIRSLLGHSNWVKNIEFSVKDKLLVTSGLDGSIYTWDINSYTECNLVYERVFNASGLMRCRLTPDAMQMVMCTTGGLLVIIHDLDLTTLARDLLGFKPNLFRLMQMSQQVIPIAAVHDHLFERSRKVNRVEFVSDFPDGNEAEVVSALQIHPQGWSALSRNISTDDKSEWSCIHDIQPDDRVSDKGTRDTAPPAARTTPAPARRAAPHRTLQRRLHRAHTRASLNRRERSASSGSVRRVDSLREIEPQAGSSASRVVPLAPVPAPAPASASDSAPAPAPAPTPAPTPARSSGLIQNDVWEASITLKQHRTLQEMANRGQVGRNFNMQRIMGVNSGIRPPPSPASAAAPAAPAAAGAAAEPARLLSPLPAPRIPRTTRRSHLSCPPSTSSGDGLTRKCTCGALQELNIRQNRDRLLYYAEETNEGKGFIKELCYSADGRLVCSPFGRGMRLLALNENCSELSHCVSGLKAPAPMLDVGQCYGMHQDLVVSSKFSPRHHVLVTGCLEGKIVWYAPYSGEALY